MKPDRKHEIRPLCTKMPMWKRGLTAARPRGLHDPESKSVPPLWDFRQRHRLRTQELLQPHPALGELPVRVLVQTILASEIGQWF